jgi:hypothetical protein
LIGFAPDTQEFLGAGVEVTASAPYTSDGHLPIVVRRLAARFEQAEEKHQHPDPGEARSAVGALEYVAPETARTRRMFPVMIAPTAPRILWGVSPKQLAAWRRIPRCPVAVTRGTERYSQPLPSLSASSPYRSEPLTVYTTPGSV